MNKFLPILVNTSHLLLLNLPVDVLAGDVLDSCCCAGVTQHEVDSVGPENSIHLVDHHRHVHDRVIRAHEGVDGGLIDGQIEALILVFQFPDVHNLIDHLIVSLLSLDLIHLRNNNPRDVDIDDMMISSLIEAILQCAIATPNMQDPTILIVVDGLFDLSLV